MICLNKKNETKKDKNINKYSIATGMIETALLTN